jgi:hypothetical protein
MCDLAFLHDFTPEQARAVAHTESLLMAHHARLESQRRRTLESLSMIEKMVADHPPLQACFHGHRPPLWQAEGNRATVFFVVCRVCRVRTARYLSADAAAGAWAQRNVQPVPVAA